MKFYSTNKKSPKTNLIEAVINGLAEDGGLYMPETIPKLKKIFFEKLPSLTFKEIAFEIAKKFFTPDVPKKTLKSIINEAFNFKIPIKKINKNLYTMELFHGPTLAFKDFAARFMAQLFGYFAKQTKKEITILVATSGDTGSAVAHGFLGVKGIKVVILYPKNKVSPLQEKQLTTMGKNITALEVDGTFDDCQKMVKQAFSDKDIRKKMIISSANSINIARLLPQSFYYFYLCAKLYNKKNQIAVSVPSGNYGNLTAGLIAKKMGAPIHKFIASTNANNIVPTYLKTGKFTPKKSKQTISNAMDVGNPSNFARMLSLYKNSQKKMAQDITGISFSDKQTKKAIRELHKEKNYILDPHGAVAYLGLCPYLKQHPKTLGVFVETAHPAKFANIVEKEIKSKIPIPQNLKKYLNRKKQAITIKNSFEDFKKLILKE